MHEFVENEAVRLVSDRCVVGIDHPGPFIVRRRRRDDAVTDQLIAAVVCHGGMWPAECETSEVVECEPERKSKIRARQSTRNRESYNFTQSRERRGASARAGSVPPKTIP